MLRLLKLHFDQQYDSDNVKLFNDKIIKNAQPRMSITCGGLLPQDTQTLPYDQERGERGERKSEIKAYPGAVLGFPLSSNSDQRPFRKITRLCPDQK